MKKPITEINVTSLVDVTMVLLIIFMITAPLLRSGIEVELPKSKADDLKPQEGVVVTLNREGILFVNDTQVQAGDFEETLFSQYSNSSRKIVLLQADTQVPYGAVINVMDKIKELGISNLGLIIEQDKLQ